MSKKNLVIVESPAKAKTIGKYLGPDYQVTACMGHLRDLPAPGWVDCFDRSHAPAWERRVDAPASPGPPRPFR